MIATVRAALIQKLVEMSHLYPGMRLGQMLAFLGSMAGENGLCREMDDEALLQAAEGHVKRRTQQVRVKANSDWLSLPEERARVLKVLEAQERPDSLGSLVSELSGEELYDVEDKQLEIALEAKDKKR